MSSVDPGAGFRLRGRHVLFAVVGFFAVVIALDATFMVLAIRSFPGQVSATPFEDGLAYNRTIARREAEARLGYSAEAVAVGNAVEVRMRRRDGSSLTGAALTATLTRPATDAGQLTLAFTEASPSLYRASVPGLTGTWDLALSVRDAAGQTFTADRRLSWPR